MLKSARDTHVQLVPSCCEIFCKIVTIGAEFTVADARRQPEKTVQVALGWPVRPARRARVKTSAASPITSIEAGGSMAGPRRS